MRKKLIIALLTLIWLTLIISLYYVYHKPVSLSQAIDISKLGWHLLVAVLLISLAGGIGTAVIRDFHTSPLISAIMQAGLGIGITGVTFFIIGVGVMVNPYLSWGLVILLCICLHNQIISWCKNWKYLETLWNQAGRTGKIIAWGCFVIALSTLLLALAPPIHYDALVYHLTFPRLYLDAGRIGYIPENIFWGMPQLGEMLYTLSISLAGPEIAACLGWLVGILSIVGCLAYVSGEFGAKAGWIGVAALLSGYTFVASLSWSYVDWFVLLFGFCSLVMIDLWLRDRKPVLLALVGVFNSFAFGTKYTGGVIVIISLAIILWDAIESRKIDRATLTNFSITTHIVKSVSLIVGFFILGSLPWLLKNFIATGNPFYPLILPAGSMNRYRLEFYQGLHPWGNWLDFVFLPLRATILGVEGTNGYSASISPLFLGFIPFIWVGWSSLEKRQRQVIKLATLGGALGVLIWMFASQISGYMVQTRLYYVLFPFFVVLVGAAFKGISQINVSGVRLGRITSALILLSFTLSVFQIFYEIFQRGTIQELLGINTSQKYLEDNLGWYIPAMQSIDELPKESRVLLLWEPRSYYCLPKCVPDEIIDRWWDARHQWSDPSSILSHWREAGFTHLMVYDFGVEFTQKQDRRYSSDDWQLLGITISQLQPVKKLGAYTLYSLAQ